ncbi:PucR family transcriptional regulator [Microcella daejeonensis]|uniref:PucR family transcriptional regulator n=1 Tax=Microcella daejeonensis TaxID=2994971 RepID=UPI0022705561|nr:PucR family transcriptional regulator [Microcella daejeonensis]WAB82975.1 PucR family transcriptional regulator [Microcella daejeonensis]
MPVTLAQMLAVPALGLRVVAADAEALARPWQWVHSSDLSDPTPFLSPGDALLTTGTQWPDDAAIAPWVERLAAAGVPAVGFGTEVVRAGTPAELERACTAHGVALFEVPYRTPFIAVARAVADAEERERYARVRWSLETQRAIAVAALKADGLAATLDELARRIDAPVALLGPDGEVALTGRSPAPALTPAVLVAARRLLAEGRRAATTVDGTALQTVGRSDALRGILAVGDAAAHDDAVRAVVTSVVAMAGLALERDRTLARAIDHLRTGLLAALLRGERELVASTSRALWGPLPEEPLAVAVLDVLAAQRAGVLELLETRVERGRGGLFHARDGGRIVIAVPEARADLVAEIVERTRVTGGLVRGTDYASLAGAVDDAGRAADRASAAHPLVDFASVRDDGVLASLSGDDTRRIAAAVLAPLDEHDARTGDQLVRTLAEWLGADAVAEAAAARLGVHRHTLRARVARAEGLLGRDLKAFPARAELWAALVAAGRA